MTYCLALRLDEGLIFLADTRTNAGVDNVGTYRKQHVLQPADDRIFVLESAGSLATTQEVLDRVDRDLGTPGVENLATVDHLFEAALYLGRLSRAVAAEHNEALSNVGADGTATFILGGQIAGNAPTSCTSIPRATTSERPTTCRSCRSARQSTASSSSSWPSARTSTSRPPGRSLSAP